MTEDSENVTMQIEEAAAPVVDTLPAQYPRQPRITYQVMLDKINAAYEPDIAQRYSCAIDTVASFIKGHKHMYHEAKEHTSFRLYSLMIPALTLSAVMSVIQVPLGCTDEGKIAVACLSALIGSLLAGISFTQYDAKTEAHRISAHQYDKLQSFLEFQSGQVLLFSDPILSKQTIHKEIARNRRERDLLQAASSGEEDYYHDDELSVKVKTMIEKRERAEEELTGRMRDLVKVVEEKIADIKETNQFGIPAKVRRHYPILYNTNVFSSIKSIEDRRAKIITSLVDVSNSIRLARRQQESCRQLVAKRKKLIGQILRLNSAYAEIDRLFKEEITSRESLWGCWPQSTPAPSQPILREDDLEASHESSAS